jgi:glycosyltransferase involved in cell wall biosynthesis
VYLGRIHPQKGITDLLSIWRIVVQTLPQAKLAIIGGGSSKEIRTLKTRIQQLDLSNNIVYLGYVDGRKKDRILRQSIVMLIPSHYESWGQVIAEGIASGLTVVAYALPAFRQIFGNVVIQVRLFSIDDFADVVLNNLKKPPLTDRVLKVRLHQIRSYAWHAIAARDYILMKSLRGEYEQKN